LKHDRGDEGLGQAGDTEAIRWPEWRLRREVAVAARETDRPVALANEYDDARHTRRHELFHRLLELRRRGRGASGGSWGGSRGEANESEDAAEPGAVRCLTDHRSLLDSNRFQRVLLCSFAHSSER
jgi:hypothetical protein